MAASINDGSGASRDVPSEWVSAMANWEMSLGNIKQIQDSPAVIETFTALNVMMGIMTKIVNDSSTMEKTMVDMKMSIEQLKCQKTKIPESEADQEDDFVVRGREMANPAVVRHSKHATIGGDPAGSVVRWVEGCPRDNQFKGTIRQRVCDETLVGPSAAEDLHRVG